MVGPLQYIFSLSLPSRGLLDAGSTRVQKIDLMPIFSWKLKTGENISAEQQQGLKLQPLFPFSGNLVRFSQT